jgi:hypothetical protein
MEMLLQLYFLMIMETKFFYIFHQVGRKYM